MVGEGEGAGSGQSVMLAQGQQPRDCCDDGHGEKEVPMNAVLADVRVVVSCRNGDKAREAQDVTALRVRVIRRGNVAMMQRRK